MSGFLGGYIGGSMANHMAVMPYGGGYGYGPYAPGYTGEGNVVMPGVGPAVVATPYYNPLLGFLMVLFLLFVLAMIIGWFVHHDC